MAIEQGPALDILRPLRVTENADLMYRWRTKQAASQFVARHGIMDVHVFNLSWLDVLAIEVA
ncbi:MAG TPA: hypothetical protein VGR35_08120 [Tepidisphaeraceae bacterium]|nr:hypothetical protein [Tepidisphaeraceae bacterium]